MEANGLATMRGVCVSAEDKLRRAVINQLLCHGVLVKAEIEARFGICFDKHFAMELSRLTDLEHDGLVRRTAEQIVVAALGRLFLRNVAMVFDAYLHRAAATATPMFSRTV